MGMDILTKGLGQLGCAAERWNGGQIVMLWIGAVVAAMVLFFISGLVLYEFDLPNPIPSIVALFFFTPLVLLPLGVMLFVTWKRFGRKKR
jgi:cytochrome b subunit of formate dehydrogenase